MSVNLGKKYIFLVNKYIIRMIIKCNNKHMNIYTFDVRFDNLYFLESSDENIEKHFTYYL